jgi:hypothetical protein
MDYLTILLAQNIYCDTMPEGRNSGAREDVY